MKIDINSEGDVTLSDVFSGVGIQTDMGLFGIAQRDGGIEVLLEGKSVWTSNDLEILDRVRLFLRDAIDRDLGEGSRSCVSDEAEALLVHLRDDTETARADAKRARREHAIGTCNPDFCTLCAYSKEQDAPTKE